MNCDLYQNPYKTHCAGSISPDGEVSVCWRHLAESRDSWMEKANRLEGAVRDYLADIEVKVAAERERNPHGTPEPIVTNELGLVRALRGLPA